ncbi:hypothetical protein AAMO2058_001573100 [Amorphochlora amoebiformis]
MGSAARWAVYLANILAFQVTMFYRMRRYAGIRTVTSGEEICGFEHPQGPNGQLKLPNFFPIVSPIAPKFVFMGPIERNALMWNLGVHPERFSWCSAAHNTIHCKNENRVAILGILRDPSSLTPSLHDHRNPRHSFHALKRLRAGSGLGGGRVGGYRDPTGRGSMGYFEDVERETAEKYMPNVKGDDARKFFIGMDEKGQAIDPKKRELQSKNIEVLSRLGSLDAGGFQEEATVVGSIGAGTASDQALSALEGRGIEREEEECEEESSTTTIESVDRLWENFTSKVENLGPEKLQEEVSRFDMELGILKGDMLEDDATLGFEKAVLSEQRKNIKPEPKSTREVYAERKRALEQKAKNSQIFDDRGKKYVWDYGRQRWVRPKKVSNVSMHGIANKRKTMQLDELMAMRDTKEVKDLFEMMAQKDNETDKDGASDGPEDMVVKEKVMEVNSNNTGAENYKKYALAHGFMHTAPRIIQGGRTVGTMKDHVALPEGEEEDYRKRRKFKKKLAKVLKKSGNTSGVDTTTTIYVTGLPENVTEMELAKEFSKCGLIKRDEKSGEPKVRVYRDDEGRPKGDGIVIFLQRTSVDLAVELMDGNSLRYGPKQPSMAVQPAEFQDKGYHHQKSRGRKKIQKQMKELGWEGGDDEWMPVHLISVVLENVFTPEEITDLGPNRKKTVIHDVKTEAGQCGQILNVRAYWKNPRGIVMIRYKHPDSVGRCIELMNGRWYARRQLMCYRWDGYSSYGVVDKRKLEAEQKHQQEAKKQAQEKKPTLQEVIKKLEARYSKRNKPAALNFETVKGDVDSSPEPKKRRKNKSSAGENDNNPGAAVPAEPRVIIRPANENSGTPFSVTPCNTDEESVGTVQALSHPKLTPTLILTLILTQSLIPSLNLTPLILTLILTQSLIPSLNLTLILA